MSPDIKNSIERILRWAAENSPQTMAQLNPPATDAEIEAVEFKIGISLSQTFKELLKVFNGEKGEGWLALFGDGNQMLSCRGIVQQYELDQTIGQQLYDPVMETIDFWRERVAGNVISVRGAVKPLTLHPKWIPFTCMNGDVYRYLDYDPASGGTMGQVIEVDPEGCSYQVLADSLEGYLANYAQQLENGAFIVQEDGYIESENESDEMMCGLPDWLKEASS